MNTNAELICPKCEGQMRTYERNGIQIEQCRECRGVFLDRGELERMIDAEGAFAGGAASYPPREDRYEPSRGHGGDREGHGSGYGKKRKSKSSFLSELFE